MSDLATQYTLYFAGFVFAVLVIASVTGWVWHQNLASMPQPPRWLEATRFIWCDVYGMRWEDLPRIVWIRGETFVCNGERVYGLSDSSVITVAVASNRTPVSRTGLAHELRHVALRRKGLSPDGKHAGPDWPPGGIVAAANQGLIDRGFG